MSLFTHAKYCLVALINNFNVAGTDLPAEPNFQTSVTPVVMPAPGRKSRQFPDVPETVEKHCGIFNDHMRRKHKEEPNVSEGSIFYYQWGGEKYECFVPKDPDKPHTILKCGDDVPCPK